MGRQSWALCACWWVEQAAAGRPAVACCVLLARSSFDALSTRNARSILQFGCHRGGGGRRGAAPGRRGRAVRLCSGRQPAVRDAGRPPLLLSRIARHDWVFLSRWQGGGLPVARAVDGPLAQRLAVLCCMHASAYPIPWLRTCAGMSSTVWHPLPARPGCPTAAELPPLPLAPGAWRNDRATPPSPYSSLPCSPPCIWRAAPGRDPALSEAHGTAWVRRWFPRLPRPCLPGISQPAQCALKNSALPLAGLAAHMTYILQLNAVCMNIKALSSVLELADRA